MKLDDEGDAIVDGRACTEARRRAADHGARPVHPLPRRRRARLQGPRFDRRARHRAGRGRQRHLDGDPAPLRGDADERAAYLKMSRAVRGEGEPEETAVEAGGGRGDGRPAASSAQERYAEMSAAEQFILTVSENGYGKRTSSHEYRVTGRGGKGIVAMAVNDRNGPLVASFPVEDDRPDHAGLRRRPDHPRAGRRHPHHRPRHAGRDRLRYRRRTRRSCRSSGSARRTATATTAMVIVATARTATKARRPRRNKVPHRRQRIAPWFSADLSNRSRGRARLASWRAKGLRNVGQRGSRHSSLQQR